MYVTDSGNHRIFRLNANYAHSAFPHVKPDFIHELARSAGSAPGHFMNPAGIAIVGAGDAMRLIVSEWQARAH